MKFIDDLLKSTVLSDPSSHGKFHNEKKIILVFIAFDFIAILPLGMPAIFDKLDLFRNAYWIRTLDPSMNWLHISATFLALVGAPLGTVLGKKITGSLSKEKISIVRIFCWLLYIYLVDMAIEFGILYS
ncbi:MAG: hypothetical protein A2176_10385 [Spirochaetes bacterium RBG_13_51_14]|nr:MAG: hypothetical protein A2176_10385 [Spirochaetes bacterium RBG_13_51_14]